jgi:enamine deaminase RidA (YjgF/YER057c/UK114 family)
VRQVHRTGGFEDLAGYSRAVRSGDVIAVSGTAGTGADGRAISPDVYEQARHAFGIALDAVVKLGGTPADVTRTRIYLVPGADWRRAIEAHRELFSDHTPANTTLYVAELIPEGALVEIELEAIVESG